MSHDLWNEFASQDSLENPWSQYTVEEAHVQSDFDEDDFGDFQSPEQENKNKNPAKAAPKINQPPTSSSRNHDPIKTSPPKLTDDSPLDLSHTLLNQGQHSAPDRIALVISRDNALQTLSSETFSPNIAETLDQRAWETPNIQPPAPDAIEEDEWGDFVEVPFSNNAASVGTNRENNVKSKAQHVTSPTVLTSQPPSSAIIINSVPGMATTPDHSLAATNQELPPSNVPPPSVLLLLILDIFESLLTDITNTLAPTTVSLGSQSLFENQSTDHIQKRMSIVRAAGRIIAGRKLRWRRDNRLSQSIKIGPANAGRSGGMKLTGIDRTESRREDGEVEEVVRRWKQHVGSLRAAVGSLTSREPSLSLAVPDISEPMPIRIARADEGAITGPSCCFLCGLKRDERVEKVEMKVEDSFGEWWVNHWGHVDCKIFWDEQQDFLPQR